MKFLGLDYGAKRVGLALSDDEGKFAFPHIVLQNDRTLLKNIEEIGREKGIEVIVIGDTRALSGEPNPVTKEAQEFSDALASTLSVPVRTVWEAWSSIEASRFAPKGREHDDASAAAIILQRYLDTHAGERSD
ncbi:Holliday junction resolvase RuvX [Candidatus Parcubacteria bacterium]|nr:MAG: Holliday junction resolvase RuvX [Candidatus Parcubacteria bacterium]